MCVCVCVSHFSLPVISSLTLISSRGAGAVYAFIFLYCIAELSVGTWVPAYATIRGLTTPAQAAALGSLFWACFTAGRVSGIFISRCVSSIRMITTDLCLIMLAVVSRTA